MISSDLENEFKDYCERLKDNDYPEAQSHEMEWLKQTLSKERSSLPPDILWHLYPEVLRFGPNHESVLRFGMQLAVAADLYRQGERLGEMGDIFAHFHEWMLQGVTKIPLLVINSQRGHLQQIGQILQRQAAREIQTAELDALVVPVPRRVQERVDLLAKLSGNIYTAQSKTESYPSLMGIEASLWVLLQRNGAVPLLDTVSASWYEEVDALASHVDGVIGDIPVELLQQP